MTRRELEQCLDGQQVRDEDDVFVVLDLGEDEDENFPEAADGTVCEIKEVTFTPAGFGLKVRPR